MQADYFRLCYLYINGGLYVDADDVCTAENIDFLFADNRLKIQPLCYDLEMGYMVDPARFLDNCEASPDWIFYFNNNPLVAERQHPVIAQALERATSILEFSRGNPLPEIQETTGPGNLSKVIFEMGMRREIDESNLFVLRSWETIAVSKWPLSYRNDMRNWRLSNQQTFVGNENCT
jgi:mannosyltransferase OCH1-like enzyme